MSKIEWTERTWNPITGCLNGCEYCYARKLAKTRLKDRYLANKNIARSWDTGGGGLDTEITAHNDPFYPRFWPERLESSGLTGGKKRPHSYGYLKCYKDHKPKGIFTCDMSDLFGIGIPEDWTNRVLNTIKECPDHRFYLLTKQPQNLIKWSPFPDNCYVGVTATGQKALYGAVKHLSQIEASVKFLSLEPHLENMFIPPWALCFVDWLITGAQTKPTVMPKIEHVQEIVEAADKAGIPVFLKNNLQPLLGTLRQEMPQRYQR